MLPRVSVVMPVYNAERFVGDAIASVLGSTFGDFEVVVLDDGSTDGSLEAAKRSARGDSRFRFVALPHGGVVAARNAGLREARAAYIANLDADDRMFPERLALQVAYLDAHPECVAVGGRSLNVTTNGQPISLSGHFFTHDEIDASLLDGNGGALGNDTAMFRKDVALAIGGYTQRTASTGEDHDMWLRMAEVGKLANLPHVFSWYRIHDSNVSGGAGNQERRLPVTIDNLRRAFERRGIVGREPVKRPRRPLTRAQRLSDQALLRYHAGDRRGALPRALCALALNPGWAPTRHTLRAILSGPAPDWRRS